MSGKARYFFDTYAIIEILNDNSSYTRYKEVSMITGLLNIGELVYWMLREHKKIKANLVNELKKPMLDVGFEDIIEGMKFKYQHIKKKFSFVDCVGYIMASRRDLIFVTGDKAFKDMPNVEFVK